MSFTSFISRRYFLGRKKMFAGLISAVSILGTALGTFALIVVMSVMMGFSRDLQEKLIGFNAHIVMEGKIPTNPVKGRGPNGALRPPLKKGGWGDLKEISAFCEMIEGDGVISAGSISQGASIRGIDEADLYKLKGVEWSAPADARHYPFGGQVLIGSDLAYQLDIHEEDEFSLIFPLGSIGPTGDIVPKKMTFKAGGTFSSKYFEHDAKAVIIPKMPAAELFGENAALSLHIWLNDINDTEKVSAELSQLYPDSKIRTWKDSNKKLFAALRLEKIAMFILLALMIAMAGVSVISVIFMFVFAKRKDIAVLRSVGAGFSQICAIFIKIGIYIGACGAVIGILSGLAFCIYLQNKKITLPSSYYLDHLPVDISWRLFAAVAICALFLSAISATYPAILAAKTDPNKLLRYE